MTGFLRALPPGSETRVLHYLTRLRGYGIAAEVAIGKARRAPGWYAYTADGGAWVTCTPDGVWDAGDTTRTEARLADLRYAPARTRIDPAAVLPGDRVTYELPGEPPFGGTVRRPSCDGVWVTEDDGGGDLSNLQRHCSFRIDWTRVTGHTRKVTA